jgi:small-conductance mechanosensitive channel
MDVTDTLLAVTRIVAVIGGSAALGYALYRLVFFLLEREIIRQRTPILQAILRFSAPPGRAFFPLLAVWFGLPLALQDQALETSRHGLAIALIAAGAWLLLGALRGTDVAISARLHIDQPDNLDARRIQTQLRVIRRALSTVVIFGALIGSLFTFPQLRQLGTAILASAGVAGIIAGLAAQKLLANLFAGFQIGFSQPIRLDDVVVVEGEWGRIEEISLTYVVVHIWDQRRLVLPISYFLEKPFTNWTRKTAELLGTVYLYLDYTAPVAAIRDELQRIAQASELWDGRVCALQVTDAREQTLELRALVSAKDSGQAFALRCEVREKLIEYVRDNHPASLPRMRAELTRQPDSRLEDR